MRKDNYIMDIKKKIYNGIVCLVVLIVLFLSYILFYNYIIGRYISDFPLHIFTVQSGNPGYSLMHKIIGLCYSLPYSEIFFSLCMVLLIGGTILGEFSYFKTRMGKQFSNRICVFFSVMLLFTSNCYIPYVFEHFYNHYTKVSQPWHNSTYILMRFLSVWVILLFYKLYDEIENNCFYFKDGFWFCLILSLCNYSKPNFFLAFAPASIFIFIYLFIRAKGKNIVTLIKWGLCYLLSMPCLFYMQSVVFDESENSKIAFSSENFVDYVLGKNAVNGCRYQFIVLEVSNLLFPMFVLGCFIILRLLNKSIELKRMLIMFLIFVVSHLEQLLMIEDGWRKEHGNFAWGVYCFGMLLFMVCIGEWLEAWMDKKITNKLIFVIGLLLFFVQIFCGLVYFAKLYSGSFYII